MEAVMGWINIALAIAVPVILALLAFFATWVRGLERRQEQQATDVANLRAHLAENYIRGPEIERVGAELGRLTIRLDQAIELLHELRGQNQAHRG